MDVPSSKLSTFLPYTIVSFCKWSSWSKRVPITYKRLVDSSMVSREKVRPESCVEMERTKTLNKKMWFCHTTTPMRAVVAGLDVVWNILWRLIWSLLKKICLSAVSSTSKNNSGNAHSMFCYGKTKTSNEIKPDFTATWNACRAPSDVERRSLEGVDDIILSDAREIVFVKEGALEPCGVNLCQDHLEINRYTHKQCSVWGGTACSRRVNFDAACKHTKVKHAEGEV